MKQDRLISLDALRGLTIVAMIIVNSPGSWSHVYAPLLHASWHGITLTDLVFPFFLFIVGVSIALAFTKRVESGAPKKQLYRTLLIRTLKIFALGLFLNLWPGFDLDEIRIAGVLQRIAIVFGVCSILFLNTKWKQQLWIGVGILVCYWGILALVPVPLDETNAMAIESGAVERSWGTMVDVDVVAQGENSLKANYEPGTNLTAWIDRTFMPGKLYETSWDPEGLFSTVPSIATGIFGMLIGTLIVRLKDPYGRVSWVFLIGFTTLCGGIALGWFFPVNKNLWSSSYVLLAGGFATLCFASCILLVDILGNKKWTKVGIVFGANAVVAYALSGMLVPVFYGTWGGFQGLSSWFMATAMDIGLSANLASLLYALLYVGVLYLPVYGLWKKRIFIKL